MIVNLIGEAVWFCIVDSLLYIFSSKTRKKKQAEWKASNAPAYFHYLSLVCGIVFIGLVIALIIAIYLAK